LGLVEEETENARETEGQEMREHEEKSLGQFVRGAAFTSPRRWAEVERILAERRVDVTRRREDDAKED
jgi:hypothetical protein